MDAQLDRGEEWQRALLCSRVSLRWLAAGSFAQTLTVTPGCVHDAVRWMGVGGWGGRVALIIGWAAFLLDDLLPSNMLLSLW